MDSIQTREEKIREYAENNFCTEEQAKIRVEYFEKLRDKIEKAKKCPECKQHTLYIESDESEYSTHEWVTCDNDEEKEDGEECSFTSEITKEFKLLHHWYDFDEIEAIAYWDVRKVGVEGMKERLECTWSEFIDRSNQKLLKEEQENEAC